MSSKNIFTRVLANYLATAVTHTNPANRLQFLEFFDNLRERLADNPTHHTAQLQLAVMNTSIGEFLAEACASREGYAQFTDNWDCSLHYWKHPELSGVFVVNMKEKSSCPRSYSFRFSGLKN